MKLLFVVPYVPNPVRVRPYQFIRTLLQRGHTVTLATVWTSPGELDDLEHLRKFGVTTLAEPMPAWRSLINSAAALPTRQPLQTVYSWRSTLMATLQSELNRETYDAVHVEHLRGSRYGLALLQARQQAQIPDLPIIWDSVDCISFLFEQAARSSRSLKGRLMTSLELGRTRRSEARLIRLFDQTLVTSRVDKQAFLDLEQPNDQQEPAALAERIHVVSNGVDMDEFGFMPTAERAPARIIFSGKMSYHANVTAALYLVREIMPLVWARRPEAEIWLVGKDPAPALRALATEDVAMPALAEPGNRRVVVTGYVDDLAAHVQRATLAVAPLLYGAGVQNKVLEALACGTPVVATPQACAALALTPGVELMVASTPEAIAAAVLTLLNSADLRAAMGKAGRSFVERAHSWPGTAALLEEIYAGGRSGHELHE